MASASRRRRIAKAVEARYLDTRVDPLDPVGTVSAQSIGEPGTQMTMNTFHYAGVAEIDVTQGLPRLIELVDARKTPDTPMMTVFLEGEYATERERAHEVVWSIEATRILALGDISTNVADMLVEIDLNEDTLLERWPTVNDTDAIAEEIAETIESNLGVSTRQAGTLIEFGPEEPSYRDLLQLVEDLRDIVFKGIEEITRVVIRKEETDTGEEFVLYTEGSASAKSSTSRASTPPGRRVTTSTRSPGTRRRSGARDAHQRDDEHAREQGLDDVNVRHLMLVADIMTNAGTSSPSAATVSRARKTPCSPVQRSR
ncbi:DNA-directed RNA polymerase subunit A'' [Halogeometricum sp. wsp3]|nr:DNA-directed RNA polymerase subunit A'' [Halogeometricum sp. wsp3]